MLTHAGILTEPYLDVSVFFEVPVKSFEKQRIGSLQVAGVVQRLHLH